MAGTLLRCDGCGQMGSPEHIARRLRFLEWATRYRPVHIQALLLGSVAPREDEEFLYAPDGDFRGEGESLLRAAGISLDGKTAKDLHAEFQAAGFFLTHILECAIEDRTKEGHGMPPYEEGEHADATRLLREHLPAVASRIRRSLKPKSVMLVTEMPPEVVQDILALDLGCEVILDDGKPFAVAPSAKESEVARLRAVLDSKAMR